jgi:hypothetical protein
MLFLTFKQVESALAGGRLDEAFDLIRPAEVRNHFRGQQLADRLAAALVARGNDHLVREHYVQAFADCSRAEQLAGHQTVVTQLRAALNLAMEKKQLAERREGLLRGKARELIDQGQLTLGEHFLAELGADAQAEIMLKDVSAKRKIVEVSLLRAKDALEKGDLTLAAGELLRVKQNNVQNAEYHQIVNQMVILTEKQVRFALAQGRIDQARAMLEPILPLAGDNRKVVELRRIFELIDQAAQAVQNGLFAQGLVVLRKLVAMVPEAKWLGEAIETVKTLVEATESLKAGPLGWVDAHSTLKMDNVVEPEMVTFSPLPLASKFVIHIDGVGSYLVVRDSRVSIGPISSPQRPLVGLIADAGLPVIHIERMDDDYFLRSDDSREQKLLSDGDQLAVGPRCRFKFRLPNAASTSAVLQLSGARLPRGDIRQVILMNRELIIGPGANAHVQCSELDQQIILYIQNGGLRCRSNWPVDFDEIPMDRPVQIGPLSFTITGDQLQGSA